MAAADQIKSLIKSFGEDNEDRFFASAIQIAASEARQGHTAFAHELKELIEKAKKSRSSVQFDKGKIVNMSPQKLELKELIDVSQPKITLSDMVLDAQVHERLEKLVYEQRNWELLHHHNLFPRRKLLLTGPPGTGKTMTAQAIAGELGLPVFIIRLDGILSKFMGESIVKLRIIFDVMPSQRGVFLFDEFDSIGSHRNQGHDIGEIKRILNSFLINIEKDKSNSIIIAATNLPEAMDKALFRRFDDVIDYPLPGFLEIAAAIKNCTKGYSFDNKMNWQTIAKEVVGLNYSDISRACEETIKEKVLSQKSKLSKSYLINRLKARIH